MTEERSTPEQWMTQVLEQARYEVVPATKVEAAVVASVPTSVRLAVTASPTRGLEPTLDLTERLVARGYDVVPHLAARMVSGPAELHDIVQRLTAIRVSDVFCPAGDATPPVGSYDGALAMLEDLSGMGRPFTAVGITGYPEPHPAMDADQAMDSMLAKHSHATYIVSNLCFDPAAIGGWLHRVREHGVELPLLLGMPGPVERAKLLAVAGRIGVGASLRFLSTHVGAVARMAAPGGFKAGTFLHRAAPVLCDPMLRVSGLHVFTFNQVAQTEQWRQEQLSLRAL